MKEILGKVWIFQDNIDTDLIVPGQYLDAPLQEIARHVLESIRPEFARDVVKGDIIITGKNFGCGSSRENAASALKKLGIGCIVAESFGRIFFRNAVAIGLPVLTCKNITKYFFDGDSAAIQIDQAIIRNMANNTTMTGDPLSGEMISILEKGGILEFLKEKAGVSGNA